jgi:hypothetical protein
MLGRNTTMNSTQQVVGSTAEKSEPVRLLDSVGWAVFFIWVGVAILANVPWGWFFIGVALLILASQFARRLMGLEIEGYWVACGAVLLVGGLWTLLNLPWPLAPMLLILLGVAMLGKAVISVTR